MSPPTYAVRTIEPDESITLSGYPPELEPLTCVYCELDQPEDSALVWARGAFQHYRCIYCDQCWTRHTFNQ